MVEKALVLVGESVAVGISAAVIPYVAARTAAKKAKESEHITIKSIVSVCRKHGISKEEAISEVMDNCELDKETAEEKVNQQW